jgi:hypothetical protein
MNNKYMSGYGGMRTSRANNNAVSRPIPAAAPVITATLPCIRPLARSLDNDDVDVDDDDAVDAIIRTDARGIANDEAARTAVRIIIAIYALQIIPYHIRQ